MGGQGAWGWVPQAFLRGGAEQEEICRPAHPEYPPCELLFKGKGRLGCEQEKPGRKTESHRFLPWPCHLGDVPRLQLVPASLPSSLNAPRLYRSRSGCSGV